MIGIYDIINKSEANSFWDRKQDFDACNNNDFQNDDADDNKVMTRTVKLGIKIFDPQTDFGVKHALKQEKWF